MTDLRCAEKDDFIEADHSVEVLYPNVHPTAHARPVFKSHFLVRGSVESDESNEVSFTGSVIICRYVPMLVEIV